MSVSNPTASEFVTQVRGLLFALELAADEFEARITPPPSPRDTTPSPPPSADESGSVPALPSPASSRGNLPIPTGEAQQRISDAMNQLIRACVGIEQVSMAVARALDHRRTT